MNTNSLATNREEKELEKVSVAEGLSLDKLKRLLEAGRVVIPRNAKRDIALKAIGAGMRQPSFGARMLTAIPPLLS
jgi:thiamine biosynthesis protein ThiC